MSDNIKKPNTKAKSLPVYGNILLVESVYMDENVPMKNFTGIPTTKDCPFIELIFDPKMKVLGVITPHVKPNFQWVPRLDENGFARPNKNKQHPDQKHQMQRVVMDTYHEHYIRTKEEIDAFLNMYAVNTDFDWDSYFEEK